MTTALDKVLLAASLMEPAALGDVTEEHHDHLEKGCPWYKAVCGGEGAHTPEQHCKEHEVSLTPRTPEASTVDQPTVPPGGPGLFHVKGMHLPPYVQHLYKHLVARYGKHEAYRVAVGVVKKWAAGVNPGGWKTKSGKGKRTHPDVKAAAAKNVAEWEEDRARAHAQSARHAGGHGHDSDEAKTTHDQLGMVLELAFVRPFERTERGKRQFVPGHHTRTPFVGNAERDVRSQEIGSHALLPTGKALAQKGDKAGFWQWAKKTYPGRPEADIQKLYDYLAGNVQAEKTDGKNGVSKVTPPVPVGLSVVAGVPGPPQSSMLPGATAPGARPIYSGQLKQQPMQTVAASPPLPPGVTLPTSAEITELEKAILKHPRTVLLTGAAMQAHAGAHKMKTGDVNGALHMLRAAQTGIYAHAQRTVGDSIPLANVFSAANPPAASTTVQAAWQEAARKRNDLRALSQQCAKLIDRIRRHHFHGNYGSVSQESRWL